MAQLEGVLVVDKPAGITSADVVNRVKRILRVRKVGHTGTLDPMATGVLPLCLGEATKIAGYLLAEDKAYEGELMLGVETDTLDAEGTETGRNPEAAARITRDQVEAAMARFVGAGEQTPPMFSALKHRGKRLYQLARTGETVDRPRRSVVIHRFDMLSWQSPRVRFFVHCSKGTYVRSLAADLGSALGCGAHLTELRRTRSGAFHLGQALALDNMDATSAARALVSPAAALAHLPGITVPANRVDAVANGKRLNWSQIAPANQTHQADQTIKTPTLDDTIRLLLPNGELLALVELVPASALSSEQAQGRSDSYPKVPSPGQSGAAAEVSDRANTLSPRQAWLRYRRVFTYGLTNRTLSSKLCGPRNRDRGATSVADRDLD